MLDRGVSTLSGSARMAKDGIVNEAEARTIKAMIMRASLFTEHSSVFSTVHGYPVGIINFV
jgi:hypothetical protein